MNLLEKLIKLKEKFDRINQQLSDPAFLNERDKIVTLSKERSDLVEIVNSYEKYSSIIKNIEGNKEIIGAGNDKELSHLAESELGELESEKEKLEEEIKYLLLPKDPNDNKGIIMEIRAGI